MAANLLRSSVSILALLAPLTGCLAAAVVAGAGVAGAVLYTENEAQRDFERPYGATLDATVAALQANGYPVSEEIDRGTTEAKIEVDDVVVRVEKHAGDFTRVRVRVGTFRTDDHKRKAKLILEDVARQLAE